MIRVAAITGLICSCLAAIAGRPAFAAQSAPAPSVTRTPTPVRTLSSSSSARAPTRSAPSATKTRQLSFPLAAGHEWIYQLTFPALVPIRHDPYFVNVGMLATSITHGTTRNPHEAGTSTISIKILESASADTAKLEINEEGMRLWFAVKIKEARYVVTKSTDTLPANHPWKELRPLPSNLLALELHGVMDMKDEANPWVLGQVLAVVPTDGMSKLDVGGWLVEPEAASVTVPAGSFRNLVHSRIPRGEKPVSAFAPSSHPAPHLIDSWVAPGVGLVKSTVTDEDGRVLYRLELTDHKP